MAILSPFKGIRYNIQKINDLSLVTTPPYDIISPSAQQDYYNLNEYNVIRIELGKDFEGDNEKNNKYTRAGSYLNEWMDKDILIQEDTPAFYVYEQEFPISEYEIKIRRGLIALVKLAEFSEGLVLPHEFTLSKAKADRFNLMCSTDSNISQIFSLYNDNDHVAHILDSFVSANVPEFEYKTIEGITERLWIIKDIQIISQISKLFSDRQLFIADGHHRYETALNYQKRMISQNPNHTGSEAYNYVMMTLVNMDDSGLIVFPTHRVIKNLEAFSSQSFIKSAETAFEIDKIDFNLSYDSGYVPNQIKQTLEQKSTFGKSFGYYDGMGKWYYILTLKDPAAVEMILPEKSPAFRDLDVAVFHSLILEQYFKINAENLTNQTNLSYTMDVKEAMEWVESGKYQCAFFLNPTKVTQVKEVSLANEKMPQKSTYFYPKLTTGLVINKF